MEEQECSVLTMSNDQANDRSGIVYILQNPAFQESIVKIGSTTNLRERMASLYHNSGVPARFTCYYARKVENASFVEKQLHAGLSSKRFNPDREFFDIDPQEVKALLEIAKGEDVTPENEMENATNAERKLAKRSMFRLRDYAIVPGSVLTFIKDNSITAKVHEDGKNVIMESNAPAEMIGKTYSLSNAAGRLLGYRVGGTDHWVYDGKTLNEIRGETEGV